MRLLSIVIATLDRHIELIKCVNSIINSTPKELSADVEVIVVDQSEVTIDVGAFSSKSSIKISVYAHERGASASRNFGAKMSMSRYIWFLDDDAQVNFVEYSDFKLNKNCYFLEWHEKNIKILPSFFNKVNIVRKSGTPFYILKRELFDQVNGFNPMLGPGTSVHACEDMDLLLRCCNLSPINVCNMSGSVSHPLATANPEKSKGYTYSRGFVLGINREYKLFIAEILYSIAFVIKSPARIINVMSGFYDARMHKI